MNVTGNMITLWSSLVETGNDPMTDFIVAYPHWFLALDFSGL